MTAEGLHRACIGLAEDAIASMTEAIGVVEEARDKLPAWRVLRRRRLARSITAMLGERERQEGWRRKLIAELPTLAR